MPDDLSGLEEEFREQLDESFEGDEMSPIGQILNYFQVADLDKEMPRGLENCLHCKGEGIIYKISEGRNEMFGLPATYYTTHQCLCIPEHDLSWFGKRVDKHSIYKVVPKFECKEPCYSPSWVNDCTCKHRVTIIRESTNTTYSYNINPGQCDVCGPKCTCLDHIDWFDNREEKKDPHGMFWR